MNEEEGGTMMMNEYGTRRGYDGRYDSPDWWIREGRSFDPRYESHLRRQNGDWMRESPWLSPWGTPWTSSPWTSSPWGGPWASPWMREPSWVRPDGNLEQPVVKVIEVFAESPLSWEDATRRAVAEASQSIRGIRSIYIKDMQAVVDEDRLVAFRVNAKISFALEEGRRRR